jgi:hypothetical protein
MSQTLVSPPHEFFEQVRDGAVHTVQAFLEQNSTVTDKDGNHFNINAQFVPDNLDNYELKGLTAIHISSLRLNTDMVKVLLSHG